MVMVRVSFKRLKIVIFFSKSDVNLSITCQLQRQIFSGLLQTNLTDQKTTNTAPYGPSSQSLGYFQTEHRRFSSHD